MPKTVKRSFLDKQIEVTDTKHPENLAELIALVGDEVAYKKALEAILYKNKYPRVHKAVSAALVEAGFPRVVEKQVPNADKTLTDVLESHDDHLKAFLTGRNGSGPWPEAKSTLQTLFQQHYDAQPLFEVSERTGGGPGKVSEKAMNTAHGFFAKGEAVVEGKIALIETKVPGYKVSRNAEGKATPESLARGIMAVGKYMKEQAEAEAAAALGEES